jgi:hypothetical protein
MVTVAPAPPGAKPKRGWLARFLRLFRFYIGIPAAAIYLFGFSLFWRPLAQFIFGVAEWAKSFQLPPWVNDFALSIAANVASALIIATLIFLFLRNRRLQSIAGSFNAIDISDPAKPVPWGKVTLRYELLPTGLFQPQFRCSLVNQVEGIELQGSAIWTKDQYLIGHYQEVGNLARRRAGAFAMQLDGNGDAFTGRFVYIDPKSRDPEVGAAKWEMQ